MKRLLVFLLSFSLFGLNAQTVITPNTTPGITQVTIGSYQFLAHFPPNMSATKKVNVMIGAPGDGETAGPLFKDTVNGFFASWNGHPGIKDTTVMDTSLVLLWVNPAASFVVPANVSSWVTAIKAAYNVQHIAVTGLSLGAQDWTNYAYSDSLYFKNISAFFLFSPDPTSSPLYGGWPVEGSWYARYNVYFYGACATQDPDGFYQPALAEYDSVVSYKPTNAPEFTSLTCACHSSAAWGPFYSKYWVDPLTGRNIYDQFMHLYPVVQSTVTPVTTTTTTTTTTSSSTRFLVRQCTTTDYVNKILTIQSVYSDSTYQTTTIK